MILLDANLLIYAVDADSPQHARVRPWLEGLLSGTGPVGLPWIVALAFLRVTTHPAIMQRPLPAERALAYLDEWLALPCVRLVGPGPGHWPVLRNLLLTTGTAGNLCSDAHIAALALEQGWAVASADNDFRRFPGLRLVNPLQD